MDATDLLDALGYSTSMNFLPSERFADAVEHAHVLRRTVYACRVHAGEFRGVYNLCEGGEHSASTPVVYVAEAPTTEAADEIHRKVWNQNIVPFLLVRLPDGVRLYSGFRYQRARVASTRSAKSGSHGVIESLVAFEQVLSKLQEFHASAIDDGRLWHARGRDIEPNRRVDWRLLDNLERLGQWLRDDDLTPEIAHALIGKFIYLRYLVDRAILSPRRLKEFEVEPGQVFGRNATVKGVRTLIERVDEWLNGSVFPLAFTGKNAPTSAQLREVAGIFLGDDPASGQLHLDFAAYDFSYIPIETLSVIYEQFLAAEERNRAVGAYYTPIPLVNFMLAEADDQRVLGPAMRVFDPSCGSGAFLVQCYRRLIERRMRAVKRPLRPTELRELLVDSVFGLDRDGDACRVTELSLVLTMLDYIEPPDLHRTPSFKLPNLHDTNIFEGDFFDESAAWLKIVGDGFDWIVGNPPWLQLQPDSVDAVDRPALSWIRGHAKECPVVGLEVAEAFAWKVASHAAKDSVIALLLPAMTLFKEQGDFRKRFFACTNVFAVANFANLREVLFAGRARMPAAAFFYTSKQKTSDAGEILVYSPLVANQEANRPVGDAARLETWTITVNRSEIRSLSRAEIVEGGGLPWKIAMWGTVRDKRLLALVGNRLSSLASLEKQRHLAVSQGLELREQGATEPVDPFPEVVGKPALNTEALRRLGRVHSFPPWTIETVGRDRAFVRQGRAQRPLAVCRPPHVVISAARNWAVYSDEFLVVPPRQIGIAGSEEDADLLRALALYLNSDFVAYHQFFDSTQEGVRDGRSTLASLRRMPTPFEGIDAKELRRWSDLHRALVAASTGANAEDPFALTPDGRSQQLTKLDRDLNRLVGAALGLTDAEQWLVEDLVHVRKELTDGRIGDAAIRAPTKHDLVTYATALQKELDAFLDPGLGLRHRVTVTHERTSGVVHVELNKPARVNGVEVSAADEVVASRLQALGNAIAKMHGQWLYFDRNLFLYKDESAFVLKPMQRLWWTRSQALADADELIAEALTSEER